MTHVEVSLGGGGQVLRYLSHLVFLSRPHCLGTCKQSTALSAIHLLVSSTVSCRHSHTWIHNYADNLLLEDSLFTTLVLHVQCTGRE